MPPPNLMTFLSYFSLSLIPLMALYFPIPSRLPRKGLGSTYTSSRPFHDARHFSHAFFSPRFFLRGKDHRSDQGGWRETIERVQTPNRGWHGGYTKTLAQLRGTNGDRGYELRGMDDDDARRLSSPQPNLMLFSSWSSRSHRCRRQGRRTGGRAGCGLEG